MSDRHPNASNYQLGADSSRPLSDFDLNIVYLEPSQSDNRNGVSSLPIPRSFSAHSTEFHPEYFVADGRIPEDGEGTSTALVPTNYSHPVADHSHDAGESGVTPTSRRGKHKYASSGGSQGMRAPKRSDHHGSEARSSSDHRTRNVNTRESQVSALSDNPGTLTTQDGGDISPLTEYGPSGPLTFRAQPSQGYTQDLGVYDSQSQQYFQTQVFTRTQHDQQRSQDTNNMELGPLPSRSAQASTSQYDNNDAQIGQYGYSHTQMSYGPPNDQSGSAYQRHADMVYRDHGTQQHGRARTGHVMNCSCNFCFLNERS